MNKTETEALWRALCACTCKPGVHAPLDCVCVHDKIVYATNSYVLHKVEGLFQNGLLFKHLHGHELAYNERVAILDSLCSFSDEKNSTRFMSMLYDPTYLALALRPHKAVGARNIEFHSGRGEHAPLVITSSVVAPGHPVEITTAVQVLRRG